MDDSRTPEVVLGIFLMLCGLAYGWSLIKKHQSKQEEKHLELKESENEWGLAWAGLTLHGVANGVVVLIWIWAFYQANQQAIHGTEPLITWDHMVIIMHASYLFTAASFIVAFCMFLIFFHRLHLNAVALFGQWMRFRSPMSVYWFLVPGFNLFRPYEVAREMWDQTSKRIPESERPSAVLPSSWWISGLIMLICEFVIFTSYAIPHLGSFLWIFVIGKALVIASVSATLHFLMEMRRMQTHLAGAGISLAESGRPG